jgi:hypothetical protein
MLVADNGSGMYMSARPAQGRVNEQLRAPSALSARGFEVVDTTLLPRLASGLDA